MEVVTVLRAKLLVLHKGLRIASVEYARWAPSVLENPIAAQQRDGFKLADNGTD